MASTRPYKSFTFWCYPLSLEYMNISGFSSSSFASPDRSSTSWILNTPSMNLSLLLLNSLSELTLLFLRSLRSVHSLTLLFNSSSSANPLIPLTNDLLTKNEAFESDLALNDLRPSNGGVGDLISYSLLSSSGISLYLAGVFSFNNPRYRLSIFLAVVVVSYSWILSSLRSFKESG